MVGQSISGKEGFCPFKLYPISPLTAAVALQINLPTIAPFDANIKTKTMTKTKTVTMTKTKTVTKTVKKTKTKTKTKTMTKKLQ